MSGLSREQIEILNEIERLRSRVDGIAPAWQGKHESGWRDNVSPLSGSGVPASSAPVSTTFGPSGANEQLVFAVNDYVFIRPFHINHDIDPGAKAYIHIHWSTDGTDANTVKWEFAVMRAKRDTEAFGAPSTITVEAAPAAATAWQHTATEVEDADLLLLAEPDELVIVTLKRITNGGTDNADDIFGLTVDMHYQSTRDTTPSKVANFYEY